MRTREPIDHALREDRTDPVDIDHWMEQDIEYVARWTRCSPIGAVWLDLKLLLKTVPAVFVLLPFGGRSKASGAVV